MKLPLVFRVAFFAAVCFSVPVTVALFVLVILNFQQVVPPAISNVLLPLVATLATVFAGFAAYQAARAAKAFQRLTAKIALSERAAGLISCLDELSAFLMASGYRFLLDRQPEPADVRHLDVVYGKLTEARRETLQLGLLGQRIERVLVLSSILLGYLASRDLTEERARDLLGRIRPEYRYDTLSDVLDVMAEELTELSARLRAEISLLD